MILSNGRIRIIAQIPQREHLSTGRMIDAALAYAEAGIPVFRLRPGTKEPFYGSRGFYDATTDPETVGRWWAASPDANIGIPTGKPSGILSLDQDVYKPGAMSTEDVERELGALPGTVVIGTGRGGLQRWYLVPPGQLKNGIPEDVLGPGVCIKSDRGYVVAPPSVTERPYRLIEAPPFAPAPEWIAEALRSSGTPPRSTSATTARQRRPHSPSSPARNVNLTSICGREHDGTKSLDELLARMHAHNEAHYPHDPLPAREVEKLTRSIYKTEPCRPAAARASEEVMDRLRAFEGSLEAAEWPGHARNRLSLLKTYVLLARRHGRPHEDGVALSVSNMQAALANGVHDRTVRRNNRALANGGWIRLDNEDRRPQEAGTVVLLTAPETQSVLSHNHTGLSWGEEAVGGLGQNVSEAPKWTAPRARHGRPVWEAGEYVMYLSRMGKGAEAGVDLLERSGGGLHYTALAEGMGIKRAGSLFRAGGWLGKLADAGVVVVDGEGYVSLTASWLDKWNERREQDGEIEDFHRDVKAHERRRAAWRDRLKERSETKRLERHQERLAMTAAACFDGPVPVAPAEPVDGLIAELERVEDARDGAVVDRREAVEVHDVTRAQHGADEEPLSGLAEVLGRFLERCPHRANERPSWLANYLWSEELVDHKPDELRVAHALGELRSLDREAA